VFGVFGVVCEWEEDVFDALLTEEGKEDLVDRSDETLFESDCGY